MTDRTGCPGCAEKDREIARMREALEKPGTTVTCLDEDWIRSEMDRILGEQLKRNGKASEGR